MKKIIVILLLISTLTMGADQEHTTVNYGITTGIGIGYGLYWDYDTYQNGEETNAFIRPALIIGKDQVFTLGIEYAYRSLQGKIEEYSLYEDNSIAFNDIEHNVGLSMGMNLNRNPVWWNIGYDSYSKGIYFSSMIGLLAGPHDRNNGLLVFLNTYISSKRVSGSIGIALHWFGDSYIRNEKYEDGGAIAGLCTSALIIGAAGFAAGGGAGSSNDGYIDYGTCKYTGCICKDGTISYAEHKQGACSWHGGIK